MKAAQSTGLHNNDAYRMNENGQITKKTNHSGGITGGISDAVNFVGSGVGAVECAVLMNQDLQALAP